MAHYKAKTKVLGLRNKLYKSSQLQAIFTLSNKNIFIKISLI